MIKINIKSKNTTLTDPLKEYANQKLSDLDKFINKSENFSMDLELSRTTKHHHRGPEVFYAEANLQVSRNKVLRAESYNADLRSAIDEVKDVLEKELKGFKGKRKRKFEKGARILKAMTHLSSLLRPRIRRRGK